ncbi:unnamed protein product [Pleuronectes platessa]|uniref:Uncharacterized protein n=1 Tax=Pleuronectes platessa TaxID=8262 RepID=A0A9N7V5V2_PLEPL|nr:unnamed protein product [Pleuronectes platessa]
MGVGGWLGGGGRGGQGFVEGQREDALLPPGIGTLLTRHPAGMLRSEPGASPLLCPLKLDHLRGLNLGFCRSLSGSVRASPRGK